MKAAVLHAPGGTPRYDEFADPVAGEGEALVRVSAAAITNIARARAAGTHYSRHETLPAVPGIDGVGHTEDGVRVYFGGPREPFGAMAEYAPALRARLAPVPDALDDVTAAALPNPGVSAWLSLSHRARLREGESVLVLGATGVTGRLAVQSAKLQGARRVVAAGRDEASLARVAELGADATVRIGDPETDFADTLTEVAGETGFDVVVDYLWGAPTEAFVRSLVRGDLAAGHGRVRLIQVGEMAGAEIRLPAAALRSSGLEIVGLGTGSLPEPQEMRAAFERVLAAATAGELTIDTEAVALGDVAGAWGRDVRGTRLVLVP